MSNYKYQPILKPFGYRIRELIQSLEVIHDSLEALPQGKLHQVIPLYGQLRALLSDKRKGNHPLLLDIAKELGQVLNFYCMPGASEFPEQLKTNLLLHLSGFPVTLEKEYPLQRLVSAEEFLDHEILIFKKRSYLAKDIIAFFANKAGGAHYSPDLPQDFAEILSVGLSGEPVLVNALFQMADVTYKLGLRLLKSQADFEMHISMFVPSQELRKPAYIIDLKYPDAPIRIFCRIEPNMKLSLGVTSIQARTAVVSVNRLLDWSKPHHFTLSLVLEDDLSTILTIAMDGDEVSRLDVPALLFVANDPLNYMSYQNRSYEDENAGLNFGLIEMAMYGRRNPLKEQAQVFLHFEEQLSREDQRCVYFKKGQYGYAAPSTRNMQMTNSPVRWSISRLLRSEFP